MAHSLSAKKRVRQNLKRRARNRTRKAEVREATKEFQTLLTAGKADEAKTQLGKVAAVMQRVSTKGVMHKNTAARRRSRLAKALNAATAKKA